MNVIDFFCGCGGASQGFQQAGLDIALGIDIDVNASATFQANFPEAAFIENDITQIPVEDVVGILRDRGIEEEPLLFAACAPCQPFSNQNKFKSATDERNLSLMKLIDSSRSYFRIYRS